VTRFTQLVGCELPIQLAAMSRTVTAPLAAAVSEAGGLGMLAMGRSGRDVARRQIDDVLELTDRPVGAGFIVLFLDDGVLEEVVARLPVVEFFWGWPDPALVRPGIVTGWQVGTLDEARAAVDAGCDYVIAQGLEAGGHVRGTTPLAEFLPAVRAVVDDRVDDRVAVVASGGIGTAADVRRALEAGADAVRVGTRFIATVESEAHDVYVDRLIESEAGDTIVTGRFDVGWPDAPVRVLASALAAAEAAPEGIVATITGADGSVTEVPRFATPSPTRSTVGNLEAMALYAGTSVGAVTRRATVDEVVAELSEGWS
jgi:NAD(P)H-dependent flavin oxidoreductase YrpB (nitropropane dioxygenase family)